MEVIKLSGNEGVASIKAASILRNGGVILYPTDTLYGLGADAFSDEAVDRVYAIKGRDFTKPIHAVFSDLAMVEEYAEVNDLAGALAEKFLPGPLTLVLKKKTGTVGGIARNMQTIGVRIPDNIFCLELARSLGKPFTTTSANLAGGETVRTVEAILKQLGKAADMIDLVIDAGETPLSAPSTVVDASENTMRILRVGAIPKSELDETVS